MLMKRRFDSNSYNKYSFKFLDEYLDNFKKIEDIKFELLYGQVNRNEDITFSFIIPTYNRNRSFERALSSVIAQKSSCNVEVLVIDNTPFDAKGTTPALSIVKSISDSRIKYYHNEINIGPGYNWNRGVQLARGKWVVFLHDDDILFPYAFRNIERLVKREGLYNKPLGYIQARRVVYSDTYSFKDINNANRGLCIQLTRLGTMFVGYTETGSPSCGTTILRDAYINCGGINYSYGPVADAVLGYQIMKDYTVIMSDVALGAYKMGENESSKVSTIKLLIQADDLFQRARNSNSLIGKCWEKVFGDVQRKRNYYFKWNKIQDYKKHKSGKDYLYDVIRIIYREMSIIYALYFEIIHKFNGLLNKGE